MFTFRYHPQIMARFPQLRSGVIIARLLVNRLSPPKLQRAFLDEQRVVLELIGDTPLSAIESLSAWRAALRSFGVDPTKYRSAAEALLRRLTKKGDIPSINALVDICNLVSIRYAIPVAAFDIRTLQGDVTVHFADGSERYTELGREQVEHPERGEVIFTDESKMVIARRWCWRQSEQSAAQLDSTEAVITIEAMHASGLADVQAAIEDILNLSRSYVVGVYHWALLNPECMDITA